MHGLNRRQTAAEKLLSWDSDYAISRSEVNTTRAKKPQQTLLLALPAIRYGHFGAVRCWIFKTHDWRREWESDAGNARESFLESDENSNEKGTLLWFYAAYNDAFMGSKFSLKFHVPCEMCDRSRPACQKHLSLLFFIAAYRSNRAVHVTCIDILNSFRAIDPLLFVRHFPRMSGRKPVEFR